MEAEEVKSDTETLIKALRVLARDIKSEDGVANAAIAEAADRLQEQHGRIDELNAGNERLQGELETGFGIIKEQQERIKLLEDAGSLALGYAAKSNLESADEVWNKAKESKP